MRYGSVKIILRLFVISLSIMVLPAIDASAASGDYVLGFVDDFGQCSVFSGSAVQDLLSAKVSLDSTSSSPLATGLAKITPTDRMPGIVAVEESYDVDIWFINSEEALKYLSSTDIDALKNDLRQGSIMGHYGDGTTMRESFDLLDKNNFAMSGYDDGQTATFYNGTWDDAREDFSLYLTPYLTVGEAWSQIFAWTNEQIGSQFTVLGNNDDDDDVLAPWNYKYSHQFGIQGERGYVSLDISFDSLSTNSKDYDWYRIDMSTNASQTAGYSYLWPSKVGWYTSQIDTTLCVLSSGTTIHEHMPYTTLSNVTKSVSIGGSLNGVVAKDPEIGAALSAEYSISYQVPDMSIQDVSNVGRQYVSWQAIPRGPVSTLGTFMWREPANVAIGDYEFMPSLIVRVPKGEPLLAQAYASSEFHYFSWSKGDLWSEAEIKPFCKIYP